MCYNGDTERAVSPKALNMRVPRKVLNMIKFIKKYRFKRNYQFLCQSIICNRLTNFIELQPIGENLGVIYYSEYKVFSFELWKYSKSQLKLIASILVDVHYAFEDFANDFYNK